MNKLTISTGNVVAALTANGTATGYAKVADNTVFYKGALVNIKDNTTLCKECVVVELTADGLYVGLRELVGNHTFNRTDLSTFLLANAATLYMSNQMLVGYNEDQLAHVGFLGA